MESLQCGDGHLRAGWSAKACEVRIRKTHEGCLLCCNSAFGKNDWDGAIREYHEATRLQTDDPDARNNLGEALEHRGDLQAALEEYRKACELDPKDPTYRSAYERLREKLKN